MHIGQVFSAKRTFSQAEFNRFAALSGDDNPIHVDPEFSAHTQFGKTVAHGMLLYSAMVGVLSTQVPEAVQVEQVLRFPTPTYVGEEITIQLTVTDVQAADQLARLAAVITRPSGEVSCEGSMLIHAEAA